MTNWDSSSSASGSDGEDEDVPPPNARQVVLKHMFTLEELEEDATLLIDLKEEVREEAESLGEVTSVSIWDVSPFLPLSPAPSSSRPNAFFNVHRKRQTVS